MFDNNSANDYLVMAIPDNLTSSSIRNMLLRLSIQDRQVHQYHKMHYLSKFGKFKTSSNLDVVIKRIHVSS